MNKSTEEGVTIFNFKVSTSKDIQVNINDNIKVLDIYFVNERGLNVIDVVSTTIKQALR